MTPYFKAAVGGTFDHFHAGHQQLLTTAFAVADKVAIGITLPQLTEHKTFSNLIEPYQNRENNVLQFLDQAHFSGRYEIFPLSDACGPTLTDPAIDVIVVSEVTAAGAEMVNRQRSNHSLPPLPIVTTPMVADAVGEHISSTNIRQGKITRLGQVFDKLFDQDIVFSKTQLQQLKSLQGTIIVPTQNFPPYVPVFLVGDMVTKYFQDHKLPFSFAIVDGRSQRQPVSFTLPLSQPLPIHNQPGTISSQAAHTLIEHFRHDQPGTIYQISGEEDLLVFVPCLTQPLNSVVLYGQPEGGIVMITLTEAEKIRLAQIIDPQFS